METIIVSLVCIALIVFGGMTMSHGFMTSVDASTSGLSEVGQRDETIIRTVLTPVSASQPAANMVEVILENDGQTKLADFNKWDVIFHYYDGGGNYYIVWLPYTEAALNDNEWEVGWIRLDDQPEIFEPGVLNPGEQIMIRAQLNPPVGIGTTNMVLVSTPSGVTASTYFSP
jgi:hypothetical protein